jgi:hypothetical protein
MKAMSVSVGEEKIDVEIERHVSQKNVLVFKATLGSTTASGTLTMAPKFDQTEAQFDIDVKEFAERLAKDCAGNARSKELIDKFLGAEILPEEKANGKDQKD